MPHTILTHGHIRTPTTGDVNSLLRNLRGRDMTSHLIMSLGVSLTPRRILYHVHAPINAGTPALHSRKSAVELAPCLSNTFCWYDR